MCIRAKNLGTQSPFAARRWPACKSQHGVCGCSGGLRCPDVPEMPSDREGEKQDERDMNSWFVYKDEMSWISMDGSPGVGSFRLTHNEHRTRTG
jgi:hypothetical protein